MRRFVTVVALLFFSIPFGISITGCGKKSATVFCNSGDSGISVGQVVTISLGPKIFGISLNQSEISQVTAPSATDCNGSNVSVSHYTYGTTDMTIADVEPTNGRLCGGTWNRNSGGGVADYTTCNPTGKSGIAYITATAGGVASNPLPVYVHPTVSEIDLVSPTGDCETNPDTHCSPAATNSVAATSSSISCPVAFANGCCTNANAASQVFATPYTATGCLSQHLPGQLAAQVFSGTGANRTNISCQVGHLTYSAQSASIVSIDQNGVATAQQPGSTIVDATVSLTGSSAGYFSTCPPVDIALSYPGSTTGTTNIVVNPDNTQPISATIVDKNGTQMSGLSLEFESTTPITIPASSNGTVTPVYPGEASITAICQPPTCNTAPQSEIGVFGNGKPITSKPVTITTPGTNSTVLYVASTDSQYIVPVDFTQTLPGAPVRLPYVPNSMVISNDGNTLYLGSSTELMVLNSLSLAITRQDLTVPGTVLAISPDSGTIAIANPARGQTYLYSSGGSIITTYGGVGTHAEWSPDSQTVYIAAGDEILVYSNFTGWKQINLTPETAVNDVAVTVPAVGAYFSGATTTARGYCPATVSTTGTTPPIPTNVFYPSADSVEAITDRLAATNDGIHILGATATAPATLNDIQVNLAPIPTGSGTSLNPAGSRSPSGGIVCPSGGAGLTFSSSNYTTPMTGIAPSAITGVLPTSDSKVAFITYTGTGGVLPYYLPLAAGGAGTYNNTLQLTAPAVAPVAGAISADNSTIYVGTTGDNLVHIVSVGTPAAATSPVPPKDTKTIAPALPSASGATGATAVPNLLVEKPRKST